MELHRGKLIAALTSIAFFRAIKGSYDLENLRFLTYKDALTDKEWQEFITFYENKLREEKKRNERQREKHEQLKQQFTERISCLKKIAESIPEITDIFFVNSYALGSLKETSDIDVLVITKPETLWWTRLKLTIALEFAGLRRKPRHIEEQFCLSFFITENAMNMSNISSGNDVYLYFWTQSVQSLFNKSLSLWHEQNSWLKTVFPSLALPTPTSPLPTPSPLPPSSSPPSFFSRLLNRLVRPIMKWRHTIHNKKLGPEASIVISDTMFKFHNIDRRQHYKEQTLLELQRLESIINN